MSPVPASSPSIQQLGNKDASLKRMGRMVRWIGIALFIFFLVTYIYTIGSQAFFYEFNIWNWFFSSDVAYKLIGTGAGILLICAGYILRTTSAPKLRDVSWTGISVVRKMVFVFVIVGVAILLFGNIFLLPRPTTVVYPLDCTPASETDRACVAYAPTYQHAFNVEQGRQHVISWTYHAVPTMYVVHQDCAVQDPHNWECKSTTGQEIFGEKNGEFYEYGTDQSEYRDIYKTTSYTTKDQWEKLNGGPEPTTYRTTPLICLLTGEYCYGL